MQGEPNFHSFLSRELSPEARLLLCAARTQVDAETAGRISALASQPLDWALVCDSADKHHLTQLLFRNLAAFCPASVPPETRKLLRHRFYTNAGSNLRLARTLMNLVRSFREADIPVIPFKGCILAYCTYGKLALRQNYDIDLFIREQDIGKCGRVLAEHGFLPDETFDREVRYRHSEDGIEADVHWGFAPRYFHLAVEFDKLFERATAASLLDEPVLTFCAEDFLEILCLQVMKDCWERRQQLEHLSKVCDIAEHLRANPRLDWQQVLRRSRQKGLLRVIFCGLILARQLLGTKVPPEVVEAIGSDPRAWKCAQHMCRALFTADDTPSPLANPYLSMGLRIRQLAFYLGMRERNRERIRHLGEILRLDRLIRT